MAIPSFIKEDKERMELFAFRVGAETKRQLKEIKMAEGAQSGPLIRYLIATYYDEHVSGRPEVMKKIEAARKAEKAEAKAAFEKKAKKSKAES